MLLIHIYAVYLFSVRAHFCTSHGRKQQANKTAKLFDFIELKTYFRQLCFHLNSHKRSANATIK